MERYGDVSFYQDNAFESNRVLDALSKQDNIPIIDIFPHHHYFSDIVGFIVKVGVKIAKVGLVPMFYLGRLFG